MRHPFVVGTAVGAVGLLAWWKRGTIIGMFRRLTSHFHGPMGMTALPANADPGICIRQIRRYTFASMQDKSPIVGLTHASYALVLMDTVEEMVGREAIKAAGYDPAAVRLLITKLQDKHAEALQACDPYMRQVLANERGEGAALPGFVFAGGAPTGA